MNIETFILGVADLEAVSAIGIVGLVVLHSVIRYSILDYLVAFFTFKNALAVRNRVYQVNATKKQIYSEIMSGLRVLVLDAVLLAVLIKSEIVRSEPANVWTTFAIAFVWFEIWFYVMHRALHHKSLYFIHRHHHESKATSALTAHSFSLMERIVTLGGGILPIALLSQVFPISFLGFGMYILASQILTVYIHLNVEFIPPGWAKIPILNWFNAPTHHAMHHARFNGHFGLYTGILDRMFASEFEDYHALQSLAYNGKGLKSFHERIKAPAPEVDLSKPSIAS